jgi:hypothetical protein
MCAPRAPHDSTCTQHVMHASMTRTKARRNYGWKQLRHTVNMYTAFSKSKAWSQDSHSSPMITFTLYSIKIGMTDGHGGVYTENAIIRQEREFMSIMLSWYTLTECKAPVLCFTVAAHTGPYCLPRSLSFGCSTIKIYTVITWRDHVTSDQVMCNSS